MLQTISDRLNGAVVLASVLVIATMLSISTFGMFSQFVLKQPLTWNFPLVKLFIPWLAMLSITVAFKHGEHIALEMLLGYLPGAGVRALGIFNQLLVLVFAIALLGYGWTFFVGATQLMMLSSTLQVSRQWVAAAVPLAGLILSVHAIAGLAAALARGRRR